MTAPIPNLFVVGAMRAGTTALHEALGAHPDVFMSGFKEPAYFADPSELAEDSRVISSAGYAGDRDRYLELFAGADGTRYRGESSTHYTKRPRINGIAERLGDLQPDPRIIYIVRDPVERTLSHYRFNLRRKYEHRPIDDALDADPLYAAVSDYAYQLEPFLDRFGAERVRLVVLEELADHPAAQLRGLYDWLQIDSDRALDAFTRRNEIASELTRARGPQVLHRLGLTAAYRRFAGRLVPGAVRDRIRAALSQPVAGDELRAPAVLDRLRALHEPQVQRLEAATGRTYPAWTTLRPS